MGNVFLNCRHRLTLKCPECNNPLMRDLLEILPDEDIERITIETLDAICNNCDSFEVRV